MSVWLSLGIAFAAMFALWLLLVAVLLLLGRRRDARDVVRFIPDCIVLFKRLLRDPRVPRRAKVALALLVPYLALPFDLIPDFIPVAGQSTSSRISSPSQGSSTTQSSSQRRSRTSRAAQAAW